MDVRETVAALGGDAVVAECAKVDPPAVRMWKSRGRFPPRVYLPMAVLAIEKGVDLDPDLFEATARKEIGDATTTQE